MSQKWRRNKAWEDENLTGALAPVRRILRLFETIPLAITLLAFISLYATLASVPIGMLAQIPSYLFYGLTLVVPAGGLVALAVLLARRSTRRSGRGARFLATFVPAVLIAVGAAAVWRAAVWPHLQYSETTGEGVRFFADFCERYEATTLRRLPGFEMTELQFYAWWPMKLALVLFVINMIVTTLRRIEFTFKNLGVLSVHTGIVVIALGSLFYQRFKLEGDVLLPAAAQNERVGQPKRSFFSREEVVLFVAQEMGFAGQPRFEQRLLNGMPRYNAYGLDAAIPEGAQSLASVLNEQDAPKGDRGHDLRLEVPHPRDTALDTDLEIEIVGYAPYANLREDLYRAPTPADPAQADPLLVYEMYADVPGSSAPTDRPVFRYPLMPTVPAQRVRTNEAFGVEATRNMPGARWDDLRAQIPPRDDGSAVLHALVIEVPGAEYREVVPVAQGEALDVGGTGWTVRVDQLAPSPPFPIITQGYEDADSSVAILTISSPDGDEAPISRWVFHRFPELNQDLRPGAGGRPQRSAPDPAIRISYLDLSRLQVYLDETDGRTRAVVRQPATAEVRVYDPVPDEGLMDIVPNDDGARIDLRPAIAWEHARRVRSPEMVPQIDQDKSLVGSHQESFAAVRVRRGDWSETVWVPFAQYIGIDETHETIELPDGSPLMIGFGRAQRPFPGFSVSLVDFEMIAYDHRGSPRDYQSLVRVAPAPSSLYPDPPAIEPFEHVVKLNAPLRAPFHWDPERSWLANSALRLRAGLNPDQFKLSQSGWDRAGWNQSQELVDQGVLDEPRVNFTILGVGNNPGIHVIALGSILISLGIPWAFYIKPWLVRRERDRLAAHHAAHQRAGKGRAAAAATSEPDHAQGELQESAT